MKKNKAVEHTITPQTQQEAFTYLQEENAEALMDAFRYALIYLARSVEESDSRLVKQRAEGKLRMVAKAQIQLINMLVGADPTQLPDEKTMSERGKAVHAWALQHQQDAWNAFLPSNPLNQVPEAYRTIIKILTEEGRD